MEGILYIIASWIGIYLVIWIYKTVSQLVHYYKYLGRLNRIAAKINSIDLSAAEIEFTRLQKIATSTSVRIKEKYNVIVPEETPPVSQFIKADEEIQRAKQRVRRPAKHGFKKRYWR